MFILTKKINFNSILRDELENSNQFNSDNNLLNFNKINSYFFLNKSYYLRVLKAIDDDKTLIEVKYFKYNIKFSITRIYFIPISYIAKKILILKDYWIF